jgi:hypothetical protein
MENKLEHWVVYCHRTYISLTRYQLDGNKYEVQNASTVKSGCGRSPLDGCV